MYIYEIINIKNDKKYIGQTIQPIKNRWAMHRRMLNNKKHYKRWTLLLPKDKIK